MKKGLFLIFLFVSTKICAWSDCMSGAMYFWPTNQNIAENSVFIINGYGEAQRLIKGLGTHYKVWLKSGSEKIELKLQKVYVGQFELTQAILKPSKNLILGKEYSLLIDSLIEGEGYLRRPNVSTNKWGPVKWKTTESADLELPICTRLPVFKYDEYIMYGCGPAIRSYFSFGAYDRSELIVVAKVKDIENKTVTTFCIEPAEGLVDIGHGMCSGPFMLELGSEFEVEFSLMDASGNLLDWRGDPLKFSAPLYR